MSQYLSTGGFKGLSEKAIDKVNLAEYREEVDLEYPQKLHNGQICISQDMLQNYYEKTAKEIRCKHRTG